MVLITRMDMRIVRWWVRTRLIGLSAPLSKNMTCPARIYAFPIGIYCSVNPGGLSSRVNGKATNDGASCAHTIS